MKKVALALFVLSTATLASAQTPQIPTLQVCNGTKAGGNAAVYLAKREIPGFTSGVFSISLNTVSCDPINGNGFPSGAFSMSFNLSDSSIGDFKMTTVDQLTTTGKHTPTMYLNGRCLANGGTVPCHYWLMLSDNQDAANPDTPDVISVLVVDKTGKRLTYGTGAVVSGDIDVQETSN